MFEIAAKCEMPSERVPARVKANVSPGVLAFCAIPAGFATSDLRLDSVLRRLQYTLFDLEPLFLLCGSDVGSKSKAGERLITASDDLADDMKVDKNRISKRV